MADFSSILEGFRRAQRMSKKKLAIAANLTPSYVSQLTLGERTAPSQDAIVALAYALHLDEEATLTLFVAAGYPPESLSSTKGKELSYRVRRDDLSEAPTAQKFFGRQEELATLTQWIINDNDPCQVILIQGIGGIGKTSLSSTLATSIKDQFDFVIWRSLHNAPLLPLILKDCIQIISRQEQIDLQEDVDEQIALLIEYLRNYRCLIVLDNAETILQAGDNTGKYLDKYKNYGTLFQRIGELKHKSCLLITSREKPREISLLEGAKSPVRTLNLSGLGQSEAMSILQDKGIFGSNESWKKLVQAYSGNPLALKLTSESVKDVFGGDLDCFLEDEEIVVGKDIDTLVRQQYDRLSDLEKQALCWLAIEREPVQLENIRENFIYPVSKGVFREVIASLRRRSMVEMSQSTLFTLQPVIMQVVTTALVNLACKEFNRELKIETSDTWMNFAFVKAQSRDYIRDTQQRLILAPIAQEMLLKGSKEDLRQILEQILAQLREVRPQPRGYMAGNILNLFIHLSCDLRGIDFSQLLVRQAYLQDISLPEVNFTNAHFLASVFTNTFGNILSIAFSPDHSVVAAGTATGDIWVYNIFEGKVLFTCCGHTDSVWSALFSHDGKTIISGSDDKTIRLWDAHSGALINTLEGHTNRIKAIALSPNGNLLASSSEDCTIRLWNWSAGNCQNILEGHTDRIWSIAFSPDGHMLASGSVDQTIRLWEVNTGNCLKLLSTHTGWVLSVAFHPNGKYIASGGDDQMIRLWDVATGECFKVLSGHKKRVRAIIFSPDGHTLASASEDQTIRLWNVNGGYCLYSLQGHTQGVRCLAYNTTGSRIVSGGDDQKICLWDSGNYHCLRTIHGYTNRLWAVTSALDKHLFVSCSENQNINIWDGQTKKCIGTLRDLTHGVRAIAISSQGDILVSGGEDRTVRKWDVGMRRCTMTLQGHKGWIRCVILSSNGQVVASGGEDEIIKLWDITSGHLLRDLLGHRNWIRSLAFSYDGRFLASGSDDQTIRIWETASGICLNTLKGHTGHVRAVSFSPDGSILASGGEDQDVRLWEVQTGECIKIFKGHEDRILSVAFHPHGSTVASSSDDGSIFLWNIHSAEHMILQGHTSRVRWIDFNQDSKLLSCSDDGTIRFWSIDSGECLDKLFSDRPYEGMKITHVRGLTEAQKEMLKTLGATEDISF